MVQFVDEVKIKVSAGNGGKGCSSFKREKYIPLGGPDGGDGGRGGSVFLIADRGISSLLHLKYKMHHKAENGKHGSSKNKYGAKGQDLYLKVPVGTQVQHPETKELLADLVNHESKCCIAKGGDPGLGNIHFKSARNRAPRKFTLGHIGDYIEVILSLMVLADVGLVGLPNAGKSSLISVISAATPKIADYPFTTIRPHLGVVKVDSIFSFVMADIPGLIEGASDGQGLGIYFLKHISRCKLLVHLVSLEDEPNVILENIRCIESELKSYDEELMAKTKLTIFTKSDLLPESESLEKVSQLKFKGDFQIISSQNRDGLEVLVKKIALLLSSS